MREIERKILNAIKSKQTRCLSIRDVVIVDNRKIYGYEIDVSYILWDTTIWRSVIGGGVIVKLYDSVTTANRLRALGIPIHRKNYVYYVDDEKVEDGEVFLYKDGKVTHNIDKQSGGKI